MSRASERRPAVLSETDPRISLVVVRGGLDGVFPLAASAADAFTFLGSSSSGSRHRERESDDADLSGAERRVLRHLPTNLTAREIADELCVSVNTVKTHMRHIYAKFDAHSRREAVERARTLGLLATSRQRAHAENRQSRSLADVSSGAYPGAQSFRAA